MTDSPDSTPAPPNHRSCLGRIGPVLSALVAICIAAVILISIKLFFFVFLNWLQGAVF